MRNIKDPLIVSNVVYGIPAIVSLYHKFYMLALLQGSAAVGSIIYHLFEEHPKLRSLDYISSNLMILYMVGQWKKAYTKNFKLFCFVPFHFILSIYFWKCGGCSPYCGGCKRKYRLYHTLWHLSGGASFGISTWFRKLTQ